MIYPDQFIPIIEENGFIRKVDYYIWEEACRFITVLSRLSRHAGAVFHLLRKAADELLRFLIAVNLLLRYFFLLALKLNALNGVEERVYRSRNYQ